MSLGRTLRTLPPLLRIGVAETVAYRAELLVWVLTTTVPLVNLGLWTRVAHEAPFRGYSSADFIAYFLAALIVRTVTGTWVAWQIGEEVRTGVMAMRLLRPVHPYLAFAATHLAAVPFRSAVMVPIAAILLVSSGRTALTSEPLQLALILPSIALAWLITFNMIFAIGALAFYATKTMALMNVYFGLFSLFSGYILPIPLLPSAVRTIAEWLPFRYSLSAPIELMTRPLDTDAVLGLIGGQVAWTLLTLAGALWMWRRGVKHFEAVGG